MTPHRIRFAVLQRVCPAYRIALFAALSRVDGVEVRLFVGDDVPGTMACSAPNLNGVPVTKLQTRFVRFGQGGSCRCMSVWWKLCGDSHRM